MTLNNNIYQTFRGVWVTPKFLEHFNITKISDKYFLDLNVNFSAAMLGLNLVMINSGNLEAQKNYKENKYQIVRYVCYLANRPNDTHYKQE